MEYNSGSNRASNFKSAERVAYLVTIFSLILIGYHVSCSEISLASGICYLIFIGSLTVRLQASSNRTGQIGQFWSYIAKLS